MNEFMILFIQQQLQCFMFSYILFQHEIIMNIFMYQQQAFQVIIMYM